MTDPIVEQLDAYNARDLERFLACYAPDVVVENGAGDQMMAGIEGMRAFYGPLFADSPSLFAEVTNRIRAGEFVIDEEHVRGINITGFPTEMHVALVFRVRGNLIVHVRLLV